MFHLPLVQTPNSRILSLHNFDSVKMMKYNSSVLAAPKVTYGAKKKNGVYTKLPENSKREEKIERTPDNTKPKDISPIKISVKSNSSNIEPSNQTENIRDKILNQIRVNEFIESLRGDTRSLSSTMMTHGKSSNIVQILKQKDKKLSRWSDVFDNRGIEEVPLNLKSIKEKEHTSIEMATELEAKKHLQMFKNQSRQVNTKFRKTINQALMSTRLLNYTKDVTKMVRGSRMRQRMMQGFIPNPRLRQESIIETSKDHRASVRNNGAKIPSKTKIKSGEIKNQKSDSLLKMSEHLSISEVDGNEELLDKYNSEQVASQVSLESPSKFLEQSILIPISEYDREYSQNVLNSEKLARGMSNKSSFFSKHKPMRSFRDISIAQSKFANTGPQLKTSTRSIQRPTEKSKSHERKFIKRPLTKQPSHIKLPSSITSRAANQSKPSDAHIPSHLLAASPSTMPRRSRGSIFKIEVPIPKIDMGEVGQAIMRTIEKREIVDKYFTKQAAVDDHADIVSTSLLEHSTQRRPGIDATSLAQVYLDTKNEDDVRVFAGPVKTLEWPPRKSGMSPFRIKPHQVGLLDHSRMNSRQSQVLSVRPEQRFSEDVGRYGSLLQSQNITRILLKTSREDEE